MGFERLSVDEREVDDSLGALDSAVFALADRWNDLRYGMSFLEDAGDVEVVASIKYELKRVLGDIADVVGGIEKELKG